MQNTTVLHGLFPNGHGRIGRICRFVRNQGDLFLCGGMPLDVDAGEGRRLDGFVLLFLTFNSIVAVKLQPAIAEVALEIGAGRPTPRPAYVCDGVAEKDAIDAEAGVINSLERDSLHTISYCLCGSEEEKHAAPIRQRV
jgi:hypothetical protein